MSRRWVAAVRPAGAVVLLGILVWRSGTGTVLSAVARIDTTALLAAGGIAVLTTVCCAWRWSLVARGLGVDLPLRTAVAACYGSQFLNTTLPGGVVGDVHRAARHGRAVGDLGRGARAVAWERLAGQAVQVALALVVLVLLPSPVHAAMPFVVAGGAVALTGVVLGVVGGRRRGSRWGRALRLVVGDLRGGLLRRGAWAGVLAASTVVVAGHAATFVIATRTAGVSVSAVRLLPLTLLVLLAMAVPMSIAGWGPREGVAAWSFGLAGLGAQQGISAAVVYGVLVLVASLPGAAVLLAWSLAPGLRRLGHG
ncbi:MAG: glycosyltransferase 2 family protein [Nocardioidaceae bacterium]|nr:glycosyltransferase 2 family protein [Nocardioidaceae bacterium]